MARVHPLFVAAILLMIAPFLRAADRLAVHEWGTFTALEDEAGAPIGGINTDDEPLPAFVHDPAGVVNPPSELPGSLSKGVPRCDPDICLRLETPVVYFHLPADAPRPMTLDLDVTFHGGWLTQYYPDAKAVAPGLQEMSRLHRFGQLTEKTDGSLSWRGLTIGTNQPGPQTDAPVWMAPRNVAADSVAAGTEAERFVFYRGVGHLVPSVKVTRSTDGATLQISADSPDDLRSLWLVDVKPDGRCALRSLAASPPADHLITASGFSDSEYSVHNLVRVRQSLGSAITAAGLLPDEANALLNTWETSYFRRPGLRLFFLVPRAWTDRVLPVHLSVDADVTRVMIGRIEIVTPTERSLLAVIATGPASSANTWYSAAMKQAAGGSLLSAQVTLPDDYRAYLQLGRFRNALILDELSQRPTSALKTFIANYSLQPG
jgi:hypothetical protein